MVWFALYSFDVDVVGIVGGTVEWAGRVGWGVATVLKQRRTVHPVRPTVKQPCHAAAHDSLTPN